MQVSADLKLPVFKLPLSVTDFSSRPAQWEFILGLFLFYVFTLASFFIRSKNERSALDTSEPEFLKATVKIRETLDEFAEVMNAKSSDAYKALLSAISKVQNEEASRLAQLRGANSFAENSIKEIKLVEKDLNPILDSMNKIKSASDNYNAGGSLGNEQRLSKLLEAIDTIPNKHAHANTDLLIKLSDIKGDFDLAQEFSKKYKEFERSFVAEFNRKLSEAKEFCKKEQERFKIIENRLNETDGYQIENLKKLSKS